MIVVETTYSLVDPTNEWVVRSWQSATPQTITVKSFPDLDDALREAQRLFQTDTELDALLHARAAKNVLLANAATITTAKNALRTAEGI